MQIKRIPTGMFGSNCYIVGQDGECAVIDPGVPAREILEVVNRLGFQIKYIILTHAHIDHMCSMDELRDLTGAKAAVHEDDAGALWDGMLNGSTMFAETQTFKPADILLKDGDVLETGGLKLKIIHTPGHSDGGICIGVDKNVFTGDTLFRMSIGRTDLGNGDHDELVNSIVNKLMALEDDAVVNPGHGMSTTIGYERTHNPFLSSLG
jgi:hydroxyacylglutathione hydrolase